MRIFVTGANGWIGSASIRELVAGGHDVVGLARSEEAERTVADLGATPLRSDLTDLDGLRAGAADSDGVLHLGYHHDFSQMEEAARIDAAAIETFGDVLADGNRFLAIASGTGGLALGRPSTEDDVADPGGHPRIANSHATLALAERGVKPLVLRFPPTVHGPGDHGFVATLVDVARSQGVSAYVGDGQNRWPAVHRLDAAALVRRAVENPDAATVLHAVAEEGVATRDIAEAIARQLDLPTVSVEPDRAAEHFGWLGGFFSWDVPASGARTQERFGWNPAQATLLEDLDAGHYTG
ncbi:nucleoside-diphosphate-sugar epimerase [Marmoricola sp. OAE513]|uniref:SDR family oxidoreductase n=1 Tax=Marmoricola sp. OAE513 TaxID=2817894 RepID=UPI001AE63EE0